MCEKHFDEASVAEGVEELIDALSPNSEEIVFKAEDIATEVKSRSGEYDEPELPKGDYVELISTTDREYEWYFNDFETKGIEEIISKLNIEDVKHTF